LGKLTNERAQGETIDNKHGCFNAIRQLEYHQTIRMERAETKERRDVQALLTKTYTDFKRYPSIQKWKAQYKDPKYGREQRFKTLVLTGPSRRGTRNLGMSLYGPQRLFYTNTQDVEEPNLDCFWRKWYDAVLVDEGSAKLVWSNQATSQANVQGAMM